MADHLQAGDWPQFLGPHRTGVSSESGLISAFPADGPVVLWRKPLGTGMSGIAVVGETAFTMYQNAEHQLVVALNAQTGKTLWETPVAPPYENAMGNGPRATPTVADGSVFVYTGEGILAKLSAENGKVQWSHNVPQELNGPPSEYGMACSPLVIGSTVIVQSGTKSAAVAAFDAVSGNRKWTAGTGTAGYSSPVLMTLAGKPQVVAFAGAAALGIAPDDGRVLWDFPFETDYDCNTATPVQLSDSTLLISSGENHGSAVLSVTANGDRFSVTTGWTSFGPKSVLRAEWQTPALTNGYLFGLDNIGSAGL
ncbi:MAG: PQQ-like beta-propeller repeat protein, partial [Planctomycetaceae bacterium]|nr:PQQ-like beta-propeller repeat protein [Planctomycetaceae bacterium]